MDPNLTFNASELAGRLHAGQFRKDGITPYIVHPARVAQEVAVVSHGYPMIGGTARECMIAAAWLHDTIEDTEADAQSLVAMGTPPVVVTMVVMLTNDKTLKGKGVNRAARKAIEVTHFMTAPEPVRLVKLADRLDNVMDLEHLEPDFAKLYAKETTMLLEALLHGPMVDAGHVLALRIRERIKPYGG